MSTVRIPPTLRVATGGAKAVQVPGGTVREVVTGLVTLHPGLEAQLLAPDGDLNRFVNAFLNDTDVRHLQDLDTPVGEGDTLVLPAAEDPGEVRPSGVEGQAPAGRAHGPPPALRTQRPRPPHRLPGPRPATVTYACCGW